MLEPQDRQLLMEGLRPPPGYELDHALATTFSLDLLALLIAPLAFSLFEWQEDDGEPTPDRMAWLEAIRRYASKLTVFCQAGQIAVPRREQLLYGYLEDSVFEVTPTRPTGVFHPKVWLLRFTADAQPVQYRLLCLSRNLTFDHSWDTVLTLDGELLDRKKAIAANHPLGDFVRALPGMCRNVPESVRTTVERIQDEVRRVEFLPPEGFDEVAFWPIGIGDKEVWPFEGRIERLLVISPFLKEPILSRLAEQGRAHVLVSRLEELQGLRPKAFKPYDKVYVLSDEADSPQETGAVSELNGVPTSGLHAKLYVADDGWKARVWTGSANATNAAFGANVEFLVEVTGKKSHCGVDAVLKPGNSEPSFMTLLRPFDPGEAIPADPDQEALEMRLEEVRRRIVESRLAAQVSEGDNGYVVALEAETAKSRPLSSDVSARVWPITLPGASAAIQPDFSVPTVAQFAGLSFESLTSFYAFELQAKKGQTSLGRQFVLNLPLLGAPTDRKERILHYLLRDRGQVLRFLLYLLGDEAQTSAAPSTLPGPGNGAEAQSLLGSSALFEQLVRALERNPARLDEVHRVLTDLRSTPEGQALLPDGLEEVWEPIWAARQEIDT